MLGTSLQAVGLASIHSTITILSICSNRKKVNEKIGGRKKKNARENPFCRSFTV